MSDEVGITLLATFTKAQTTVDGGWRISFDVNQDESAKLAQLAQFRDTPLQLAVVPLPSDEVFGG